jgi:hypothetical protein
MDWKIDPDTFAEAQQILGLTYPVRVRELMHGPAGMQGKYHGLGYWGPTTSERLEKPAHHISLKADMSPYMANTCLWHEMYHATQAERYLPENGNANGREPYQIANKGLRQAFGEELREIRARRGITPYGMTADYGDVSFEVEAREVMNAMDKMRIILPTDEYLKDWDDKDDKKDEKEEEEDPLKGYRAKYRVDVYDDKNKFVATQYVLADDEYGAKKFARERWLDGKWSNNMEWYICAPPEKGGE